MRRASWLVLVTAVLVGGCKSEGRKATDDCLAAKGLERATKCTFACSTYATDDASKESCPAAKEAMKTECFKDDTNSTACKDICRQAAVGNVPADLRPGCDALLKY